jgi:hypothetical protein
MSGKPHFPNPWPAPQHLWADPPWVLSGTSITAWFEVDAKAVANLVSPAFKSLTGDTGVITRLRFYDIKFEPRDGTPEFKKKFGGTFKEAVVAFKGSIADVDGEYGALYWTDDDIYFSWGREIFGWPLIKSDITLKGKVWDASSKDQTHCRVQSSDFDLSITMDDDSAVEQAIGKGPNWLTPRRVIFPAGNEPDRHDLNIVRPTIIDPGNFYVHQGSVMFDVKTGSMISGLKPLTKPVIHRHANFKICVGDNVETIQGIG